jgi:zinc protease
MPLRPVRFPPFINGRLPNGMATLTVSKREQPVITISLSFPAGSFYEPDGKAGLASMAANLLTKGTERRTADQIAAEIEGAGGSIGAGADDDFLTVTVSGLSENVGQLFDILGDVVQHASFPATEVDLARTQALSGLQAALADPGTIAGRNFGQQIYGSHPYGRVETPASLRGMTRDDVTGFYGSRIKPMGALLVVAGDITPARVQSLAAQTFGGWTGSPAAVAAAPAVPARTGTDIVLVHKPGAVQSNLVAGFPFITPRDPSFYALTVMNRVLGGGADSRLFLILREQKGWTYGAYSGFSRPRGIGAFQATAQVRTEVTDSALGELMRQLDRMRTTAPADSEITAAKNYLIGRFPLSIETADEIAGRVANARLLGLPDDYVLRYRERLDAVTRLQIQTAARRYLTTDRMAVIVVGDGTRILAGLKALGAVRIVNTEGQPMTEEDLHPRTSTVAYHVANIAAGTTTHRVMVQGNAFGEQTRTVARVQEGGRDAWQVITQTTIGPILSQNDTSVFDAATMAPIRVRQGGRQQGQVTFVRLDYAGGRVRGQSKTLAQTGPRELTIDTTVAPGVLDDNQAEIIMSVLPYAPGANWTLPVFSGGKGAALNTTITVQGEETVTVPAGTFACWKVQVSGGEQTVIMFISKERPGVVRLELQGIPVVFELTQRN